MTDASEPHRWIVELAKVALPPLTTLILGLWSGYQKGAAPLPRLERAVENLSASRDYMAGARDACRGFLYTEQSSAYEDGHRAQVALEHQPQSE